jgi:mono/diheme cytochrome c family protein
MIFSTMFLTTLLLLAASPHATLPPGKGKAIVQRTCVSCHALKVVTSKRATKEQWTAVINLMLSKGADLDDDEVDVVVDYLAKNFGPIKAPGGQNKKGSQSGSANLNKIISSQF